MRGLCYFLLSILTQGESIFCAFLFSCICKVLVGVRVVVWVCACVEEGWCIRGLHISELQLRSASCPPVWPKSLMSSAVSSSTVKVIGLFGHNVTLPCKYDTQAYGVLEFCWGRGKVPRSKCSNTVLSSHDGAVLFRQSPRYQLMGSVTDGDVSLTILNAQWSDAGVYGCRVEIPGWFNDHWVNTHLVVEEGNAHENGPGWLWTLLCNLKVFYFFASSHGTTCYRELDTYYWWGTRWAITCE